MYDTLRSLFAMLILLIAIFTVIPMIFLLIDVLFTEHNSVLHRLLDDIML